MATSPELLVMNRMSAASNGLRVLSPNEPEVAWHPFLEALNHSAPPADHRDEAGKIQPLAAQSWSSRTGGRKARP